MLTLTGATTAYPTTFNWPFLIVIILALTLVLVIFRLSPDDIDRQRVGLMIVSLPLLVGAIFLAGHYGLGVVVSTRAGRAAKASQYCERLSPDPVFVDGCIVGAIHSGAAGAR